MDRYISTSATNYFHICTCGTTPCTCPLLEGTITYTSGTDWPEFDDPDDDPPKKNDPVPPWLAGAAFGGKMRKTQRGVEYSSQRGLRMHRRQAR